MIFCFDNDEAGLKAAERSIDLAQNRDFSVRLLILEDYKDPADAVKHKPGILEKLAQKAKPAMEFYFNRYLQSADKRGLNADKRGNISDLKNNIRVVLAKIKNLASPIERQYWLHELALKTRVKEEALNEEMGQLKIPNYKTQITNINTDNAQNNKIIPETRMELLAQKLIGLMSLDENLYSIAGDFLEYLPENYSMVARSLVEKVPLESEEHNNLLGAISLKTSFEIQIFDQEKINNEFQELARQLRLEYLRNKRQELVNALKEAESDGGEKDVEALLREFDEISKLMHN